MVNPPDLPLLCTLFSASNYQDGNNEGAYLVFCAHPFLNSLPTASESSLPRDEVGSLLFIIMNDKNLLISF